MKNYTAKSWFRVAAVAACVGMSVPAVAQERGTSVADREDLTARRAEGQQQMAPGRPLRLSGIIGEDIENASGDDIAEIKDLVLDSRTGKVRYVVVQYGGFLGVGDKMFAVPFEAFQIRQEEPDDPGDYDITLNVTEKELEGARGFDEDRWPDFANTTFTSELDRRYNVQRDGQMRDRNRVNGLDDDADDRGVEIRGRRGNLDVDIDEE